MFHNHIAQLAMLLFYKYLILKFLERSLEEKFREDLIKWQQEKWTLKQRNALRLGSQT